jgi:propionate CoA-transferase
MSLVFAGCDVLQLADVSCPAVQIAPGLDLERDVLAHMPFRPLIEDVRLMDARCFLP